MRYTALNVTFKRCMSVSGSFQAKNVPLSRFEPDTNLPYEKLQSKLAVVRKR